MFEFFLFNIITLSLEIWENDLHSNLKGKKHSYLLKYEENNTYLISFIFILKNNYSKPTCGMVHIYFAYLWFNHLHFAHLSLFLLRFCYPLIGFSVKKKLLPLKHNITRIKKLGFEFFERT